MYKQEYSDIQALIRYHDKLNDKNRKDRDRELEKIYHPFFLRKLLRKTQNIFKTVRDSLMDVVNLLIGQTQKTSVGRVLKSQEKYVSGVKKELAGAVEVSYEPLLERYIGNKVILRMTKGDKTYEFRGVLRDYTAEFMEIMDVDYSPREDCSPRKADLVILRTYGMIRHLGE